MVLPFTLMIMTAGYRKATVTNAHLLYILNKNIYDIGTSGLAFKKTDGVFFCPTITTASASPCWNGDPEGEYYYTNYSSTRKQNNDDPRCGGWRYNTTASPSVSVYFRKLNMIKNGCIILGEQNFYRSSLGANMTNGSLYQGLSVDSSKLLSSSRHSPGWNHSGNSNFLFKDGHVKSLRYNGSSLYDGDFIVRN